MTNKSSRCVFFMNRKQREDHDRIKRTQFISEYATHLHNEIPHAAFLQALVDYHCGPERSASPSEPKDRCSIFELIYGEYTLTLVNGSQPIKRPDQLIFRDAGILNEVLEQHGKRHKDIAAKVQEFKIWKLYAGLLEQIEKDTTPWEDVEKAITKFTVGLREICHQPNSKPEGRYLHGLLVAGAHNTLLNLGVQRSKDGFKTEEWTTYGVSLTSEGWVSDLVTEGNSLKRLQDVIQEIKNFADPGQQPDEMSSQQGHQQQTADNNQTLSDLKPIGDYLPALEKRLIQLVRTRFNQP